MQRFMTRPVMMLLGGIAVGAICAAVVPGLTIKLRNGLSALPGFSWLVADAHSSSSKRGHEDHDDDKRQVVLSDEQIARSGIPVGEAGEGELHRFLHVPGRIVPSGDRIARVAVKIVGTVSELRKRPGELVAMGEVVAVIDSRELADAKSEFLATRLTLELQRTLAARAKSLAESRTMAENEYLRVRNAFDDAQVKRDSALQKLAALGLTEDEIAALPSQPLSALPRHELRAPISGTIAERRVDLGAPVGREGVESELYVIVDLREVWAELAVGAADVGPLREGQPVDIAAASVDLKARVQVILVNPLLDKDTHSARVVTRIENPSAQWRPGTFVTADIPLEGQHADVVVPNGAIQTVKGEPAVFVRTAEGFEVRPVKTGRDDGRVTEITEGLKAGEPIALANTFVLKAELGKSEIEHDH
jgi:cobalt-zinc-cadmium efflux system membrane fusion protein